MDLHGEQYKSQFPFSHKCLQYVKVTDMIEHVRRSTLIMTNLNTTHKSKDNFRLYHIVENDFATTVTVNLKLSLT